MAAKNYSDLIAWQKAMDLVELIYKATSQFPKEEVYGLTNQLRRAAVSVPSNIAEGPGRGSVNDFRRFFVYQLRFPARSGNANSNSQAPTLSN